MDAILYRHINGNFNLILIISVLSILVSYCIWRKAVIITCWLSVFLLIAIVMITGGSEITITKNKIMVKSYLHKAVDIEAQQIKNIHYLETFSKSMSRTFDIAKIDDSSISIPNEFFNDNLKNVIKKFCKENEIPYSEGCNGCN